MEIHVPLILLVFVCVTRPSVVTQDTTVFTLEGGSVMFEKVQRSLITEFDEIVFKFNSSKALLFSPQIEERYKGRLIFNTSTFSLKLKNLQKDDSGLYECLIRWNENTNKLIYKLLVLEPVAAPVLTVVSNWSSSDSCNLTVTCRGHDLSLTFICNHSDCTQLGDLPITPTLLVYIRNGTIVCNHSNQVSWRNATLDITPLCDENSPLTPITLTVGLVFAWTVVAFAVIYVCSRLKSTGTIANVYVKVSYAQLSERTAQFAEQTEEAADSDNDTSYIRPP